MRPNPSRRSLVGSLAVITVLLAACGGDDDDGGGELSDDRTEAEIQDDVEVAEGIVLTIDDLPQGWTPSEDETPTDSGDGGDEDAEDEDDELNARLFECMDIESNEAIENERASADSPEFGDEEAYVGSSVTVFPDEEYAEAAFEPFRSPKFQDCFAEAAQDSFEESASEDTIPGLEFTDVQIDELDFPDLGDDSVALRLTLGAEYSGQQFESVVDFVAFRTGRFGVTLDYGNLGEPFDRDLAEELAGKVEDRAGDA